MNRRRAAAMLGSGILALLVSACSHSDRDYYPLTPGARWQYRLWGTSQEGRSPLSSLDGLVMTQTTLPQRDLDGQQVIPQLAEINGHLGTAYVTAGANGIYSVAFQLFDNQHITKLDEPSCVLRFPLRIGLTCDAGHTETVGKLDFPISGTQRTEAIDDTVAVPAGTYRHCVRVKTELKGSTRVAGVPGKANLEATTIEWYAPDVGLVRQIGWEVADPVSIGWGTRTMELMSFKK